jgi:hypothetical protein
MKLKVVFVWRRKKVRNANITIEKKIIAMKNMYKIGDVLIFLRRFLVISLRRSLLVSNMVNPNPSLDVENKVLYIRVPTVG